jgi:hypothetical protein
MDTIKKNLDNITNNNVNYIFLSFIIVFLILFSFFTWLFNKLRLQGDSHCHEYKTKDDNDNSLSLLSPTTGTITTDSNLNQSIPSALNSSRTDLFRNFYYLTAYNCCSGRNYKNNWVNTCALTNALKIGARCLDFEIYSLNNEAIISTSTTNDYTVKETYNYINFDTAMELIRKNRNSNSNSNKGPLILLFRIKSLNKIIYDKMGRTLYDKFYNTDSNNNQLLSYYYNHQFIGENTAKLYTTELKHLKNKIIIAVHSEYVNFNKTNLSYVTNMKVGKEDDANSKAVIYRDEELMAKGKSNQKLINDSQSKFIFVLPSMNNTNKNMDSMLAFSNGCQCIAMKLQFYDNNLASYYNLFKTINNDVPSPYALKQFSKRKDKESANTISDSIELNPPDIIDYFN